MKLNELFELYLEDIDLTHQDTTLDSIRYVYNSGLAKKYGNKKLESIKFKEIKKYQKELWELYNIDKKRPNKNPDGIPMNVFDHLIFSNGTLHFDRLSKYQNKMQPAKKQQIKKRKKH